MDLKAGSESARGETRPQRCEEIERVDSGWLGVHDNWPSLAKRTSGGLKVAALQQGELTGMTTMHAEFGQKDKGNPELPLHSRRELGSPCPHRLRFVAGSLRVQPGLQLRSKTLGRAKDQLQGFADERGP